MAVKIRSMLRLPLQRIDLTVTPWTQVQATGWTVSNPSPGTLRLAWDGSGSVVWTDAAETGLALVLSPKLGIISNGARLIRAAIKYNEATANGIGVGVGFCSAASPVGAKWMARSEVRDGSGTVSVQDYADSASAPTVIAGQTRRNVIVSQPLTLTSSLHWSRVAGAVPGYNERRYAGTQITWTEGADVYLCLFGTGGGSAGSVDITELGLHWRELDAL